MQKLRKVGSLDLRSGLLALAVAGLAFPASAQTAPGQFFFKDGDRIQILGDSITQQRMYSTLMESYILSRFPTWKVTVRNTGWGGDTMNLRQRNGLDKGFTRDIEPLKSTAVTIDFGMNDGRNGDRGYDLYVESAKTLADKFKATGARIAFVTSSSEEKYDAGQPAGSAYNTMLRKYSDGLKVVAADKGVPFVDQLNPMIKDIESARAAGVVPSTASPIRFVPDAVHPNWGGSFMMATYILKGLNAPALVSRVEVDATSGKFSAEGAKVSDVKPGETLSFTREDGALPWPIPAGEPALALKIPGFTPLEDLSKFDLKMTGLKAAKYEVAIDGKAVGAYKKEDLEAGVNLTVAAAGPISDQAKALLGKISQKNDIFYQRWRGIQLFEKPTWMKADIEADRAEELKRLDGQIAALETDIDALRIPKPHVWSLKAVN